MQTKSHTYQQSRDPRFLPLSGEFSADKYAQHYAFLADAHKEELSTLRTNLKRAKKLLQTSPKAVRADREAEVQRLEFAVKRAESEVNKDKQTKIQQQTLFKLKREEQEKRQQGKGAWYLKTGQSVYIAAF